MQVDFYHGKQHNIFMIIIFITLLLKTKKNLWHKEVVNEKATLCLFHTIRYSDSLSPTIYTSWCSHIQQPLCNCPCYLIPHLTSIIMEYYFIFNLLYIEYIIQCWCWFVVPSNPTDAIPAHPRTAATTNSRKTHWLCT